MGASPDCSFTGYSSLGVNEMEKGLAYPFFRLLFGLEHGLDLGVKDCLLGPVLLEALVMVVVHGICVAPPAQVEFHIDTLRLHLNQLEPLGLEFRALGTLGSFGSVGLQVAKQSQQMDELAAQVLIQPLHGVVGITLTERVLQLANPLL